MNNKKVTSAILLGLTSLSLVSCTPGLEEDMLRMQKSLSNLRSVQADQTVKISALEEDVRKITGGLEELNYSQDHKLSGAITSLQDSLSQIKRRVPPPTIVPQDLLDADQLRASDLTPEVAASFTQGLSSLREGNFERAEPFFTEVLDVSNGGESEIKSLFWRAVTYEGLENHKRALEDYIKLSSNFPKSNRAPIAMLRQSSIFVRLGDTQAAKLTLGKLVADYPKSDEASEARRRLKDL